MFLHMENVIELLKIQAERKPNQLAIVDENRSLTYKELFDETISLASYIFSYGLRKSPIIVKVNRSLDSIVAFFAILLSSNYYIPVDEDIPNEKLEKIIKVSKAMFYISPKDENLTIQRILPTKEHKIDSFEAFTRLFSKENYSYLMFTSGSTGEPKGVIKNHENIISFVNNFLKTFPFLSEERIANQTPFFFDASMKDIYLTLALGATLYIPSKVRFSLPTETIKYLNENKITMIYWVPSILTMIARMRIFNWTKPETLKYVFFVGEVMNPRYLNMWIDALPNIRYFNTYGSTEIMGVCLYHEIKSHFDGDTLPTGKAIKNNNVKIINGEIVVTSKQVAVGYLNKPFEDHVFKTGDYASLDEDGNIVFSSRKDFQIKHLGYRIELQDIEANLSHLEYIDTCVAIYDEEKDQIILFVVLSEVVRELSYVLLNDAKKLLQSYMIPNKVIEIEKMPLNNNGKIDRLALKEMYKNGRN